VGRDHALHRYLLYFWKKRGKEERGGGNGMTKKVTHGGERFPLPRKKGKEGKKKKKERGGEERGKRPRPRLPRPYSDQPSPHKKRKKKTLQRVGYGARLITLISAQKKKKGKKEGRPTVSSEPSFLVVQKKRGKKGGRKISCPFAAEKKERKKKGGKERG